MKAYKTYKKHWSNVWQIDLPLDECWVCGVFCRSITRAHVVAKSKGGNHNVENILLACKFCNHVIDSVEEEHGAEFAVSWVKKCSTEGFHLPPLVEMLKQMWALVPESMDMFVAQTLMEAAYTMHARQRQHEFDTTRTSYVDVHGAAR